MVERRLEEQLTLTLDRIGIPSQQSIIELEGEIARVSARVESLEKRGRAGAARSNGARRA